MDHPILDPKFSDTKSKVELMRQKRQQGDYKKVWRRDRERTILESSKVSKKKLLPYAADYKQ